MANPLEARPNFLKLRNLNWSEILESLFPGKLRRPKRGGCRVARLIRKPATFQRETPAAKRATCGSELRGSLTTGMGWQLARSGKRWMADQFLWLTGLPDSQFHRLDMWHYFTSRQLEQLDMCNIYSPPVGAAERLIMFDILSVGAADHVTISDVPSVEAAGHLTILTAR